MLEQLELTQLKGVGEKQAEKLQKLGLKVVQDLLFHLPLRFQDKTKLTPLNQAEIGTEIQIQGQIIAQRMTRGRRPVLVVDIRDDSGLSCSLTFFNFYASQARQFKRGDLVRAYGELRHGMNGFEISHPHYKIFTEENEPELDDTLTPIYPTTEGLGQATLQKLIRQAMVLLQQYPLAEGLNQIWLDKLGLPPINDALKTLHQPQPTDDLRAIKDFQHPAQHRLIVEELLTQQLALQLRRQAQDLRHAPALAVPKAAQDLLANLPFQLTKAQQRVWQEIQQDLQQTKPMQRLVQGDVGSGKTIIAALAAMAAVEAGFQVAIMAPTEILAEQHRENFALWFAPFGYNQIWLSGSLKVAEKRSALAALADGTAQVAIGTHALFQDKVQFHKLGLVIIDEQHRFGVHQRLSLTQKTQTETSSAKGKDFVPHQLTMTATPIPRTLAMTAYGDLDISVIDELPVGRLPVQTAVLSNQKRFEVMGSLYAACQQGTQAYWVCPLIEESEVLDAQAAESTFQEIQQLFPDLRVGLVHGRMKDAEKQAVMQEFKAHNLDLLVATTVIEVGVNVPNASLMVIENAERLGLSQLHQLRGRVGRGNQQSHCVLMYQNPLSENSRSRLQIMRETNDGFIIAEEDLRLRGAGEILGTRQTGGLQFRIADLERDQAWLEKLNNLASTEFTNIDQETFELLQARWIGRKIDYQHA